MTSKTFTAGILGGSFNPVHNGHIALARQVVEAGLADEVWLTLSPLNPLKAQSDELIDDRQRLELYMPRPSYTINTLNELSRRHPEIQFRLLIGADNMQIFDRWKASDEILERFSPIVYPRAGYDCPGCMEMEEFAVSSTEIRERIRAGLDVNNLVPEQVGIYIREHGLYAR